MLKNKRSLLMLIFVAIIFFVPNMVQAKSIEATETTTTSTGIVVKWEYELDSNNDIVALMCVNKSDISGSLTIPSTIDGYTVKEISKVNYDHTSTYYKKGTFEKAYGLQSVTIPNTVTVIGDSAFEQCTGLKQLVIPDNVKSIGSYAYRGCTGIKQLIIPDSVTNIEGAAFKDCSGITSLTLSKNITIIKDSTFEGCKGLTVVKLPDTVTTLEGEWERIYGAFGGCSNLTKILIPDSVVTIGKGALRDCPKLTIYGNDGQASKTYAEENQIKFDYIANWDKASSGTDITAPTVESILIKSTSVSKYWDSTINTYRIPTGGKIQIVVAFSEEIKGTVPTLKIKCGEGQTREITNGTISGKTIIYDYTIQSGDEGIITSVSYEGENITDNAGNKAELSCPSLYVQYTTEVCAYANGTSAKVEDNNQNNNNQSSDEGDQTPTSDDKNNNENGSGEDPTIKDDEDYPQTGITVLTLFAISLISIAIISKLKYVKYKNI